MQEFLSYQQLIPNQPSYWSHNPEKNDLRISMTGQPGHQCVVRTLSSVWEKNSKKLRQQRSMNLPQSAVLYYWRSTFCQLDKCIPVIFTPCLQDCNFFFYKFIFI